MMSLQGYTGNPVIQIHCQTSAPLGIVCQSVWSPVLFLM